MAVTHLLIPSRQPFADGQTFGPVGPYEQLSGTVYFAVDPLMWPSSPICLYTATGAPITGLGLLATRDLGTFLRYGDAGVGNPCAGDVEHAYSFGVSQKGKRHRPTLILMHRDSVSEEETSEEETDPRKRHWHRLAEPDESFVSPPISGLV